MSRCCRFRPIAKSASGGCLATTVKQTYQGKKKMFTSGVSIEAARQAVWEAVLADREAARENVRNASTPTMEDLIRSISPVSTQYFGEHVGDVSLPGSGRASVDSVEIHNASIRAELHLAQSLERIEGLEGELKAAQGQVRALQWSRELQDNRRRDFENQRQEYEKNSTRMVRELERVHEVLPMALEMHRAKTRALYPEEEEELVHHFLQKGNVVETFLEITGHGEGMVRVTTERDEIMFAPMRSSKRKRFNIFRCDRPWRADHPWVRLTMGAVHLVNYGRTAPLPQGFSQFFLRRNIGRVSQVKLENFHCDDLEELCKARRVRYSYKERLY